MSIDEANPIRVALIGFGLGGAVFHAPLVSTTPGMTLATVVTSDPERQARARARYPEARIVPNVDGLWELAPEHDLVVVATPNRFHVPLGLAALEAGLSVVVDKPMAPSAEDGRRLIAAASERGLPLSVFQNRRWDGDFLTVRRLLSEDALGPIVRFESRFERWRPAPREDAWRERGDPEEAGGLLFDLGSHLIDQAVQLFGAPTSVYAEVDRRRAGAEVDDDVFVALTHPGGVRSHLWMSVLAAIRGPRLRLLGLRAAYEKFGLDPQEDALAAGSQPTEPNWGREPEAGWGRLSTGDEERPVETEAGAYPDYYRGMARAIREGTPVPVDPRESVAVLEIIGSALESSRTGTVVPTG